MTGRRIEHRTSRTASWTCVARAASSLERDGHYRSGDNLALLLVPTPIRLLLHIAPLQRAFTRFLVPKGIYEYTIARTKYIDSVFRDALAERFDQILIFGAGFDTRGLRFQKEAVTTTIFELDVPVTQAAKIRQYEKRGLSVPKSVVFVPIDFETDSLLPTLEKAGFRPNMRSLYVLEGILMYLRPQSVHLTLADIAKSAGAGSEAVFDYVQSSVLRREGLCYGEGEILEAVTKAGEEWHFGLEKDQVGRFLSEFGLEVGDHKDAPGLERMYFTEPSGRIVGRINETHCLVRARKAR